MLLPATALYSLGWLSYQAIYDLGLKKPYSPHQAILTVGNLLVGGTGKSPTTLYVESIVRQLGWNTVVSVSGYGAPRSASATIAPAGELDAREWGDEAAMMRWFCPNLDLVVGRDRVRAAELVHETWPERVMLMDDGLQHLRLRQPLTIVLDPPVSNTWCIPSGPYREPRAKGRSRANLTLPSNEFKLERSRTQFKQTLGRTLSETPRNFNLLCALARPYRLVDGLKREGFDLATVRVLPDHDPLSSGTLLRDFDPATPLVVTAKDWVKLRERPDLDGRTVFVCWYESHIEPEQRFKEWLKERLDEFRQEASA